MLDGESEEEFSRYRAKYTGNKWGGKYLRAPDIFFTILEKGKGKLVRLGDIAEIKTGIITGLNKKFYQLIQYPIPQGYELVFKSPKEVSKILLRRTDAINMIMIQNIPFHLKRAPLLWPDLRGNKHLVHFNPDNLLFEHNFYGIIPPSKYCLLTCALLNLTLIAFIFEVLTRRGLGGGAARLVKIDIISFPCINPAIFTNKQYLNLLQVFNKMAGSVNTLV